MMRLRKTVAVIMAALVMAALPFTGGAQAAELGGDSRADSPILPTDRQFDTLKRDDVQDILNRLNARPPKDVNTKTELRREIKKIELIRIDPKNGNNPFNSEDPIDNATVNGLVQQVAVDDLNGNNGGNNDAGNGLDACIGQTVQGQASPSAPPELRFVNMEVDPVTLDCRIFGGQSIDGAFLIFQFGPNDLGNANDQNLIIFPDATVPVWRIIDPAGGLIQIIPFLNAQTLAITLQAGNGTTVRVTVTVTPIGAEEFSAMIVNIEVLP